ncbi:MAG: SiaB family protein kinase [Bacteroidota bacterium]
MQNKLYLNSVFYPANGSEVVFAFNGVLSQDLIVSLGETVRGELSYHNNMALVNRIFAVFIEMTQNILHYSSEKFIVSDKKSYGIGNIVLLKNKGFYEIISTNMVEPNQMEYLNEKCRLVNRMTQEELKQLYIIRRRLKTEEGSKGAGLGLIDIVRKTSTPLEFDFLPLDNEKYQFVLKAKVDEN